MDMFNFIMALGMAGAMAIMLARLFAGPTLYDRVLAANSFGTKTILFLLVFSALSGRQDAIDIAMLYALINFVATIAILKFFRYRSLEISLAQMSLRPDFYTRMHAAGVTDTLGAELVILGLILQAGDWQTMAKLALVGLLLFLTSPTATHAVTNAAHRAGHKPDLARFKPVHPRELGEEEGKA